MILALGIKVSTHLPSINDDGKYEIYDPTSNQVFIFSSDGRHLQTNNLITGSIIYKFLFSKERRLVAVTDANLNDLVIDYTYEVRRWIWFRFTVHKFLQKNLHFY